MFRVLVFSLLVSGCAVDMSNIPAKPRDARALTAHWCASNLRDPASAQIGRVTDPVPGYSRGPMFTVDLTGWIWSAWINGRNGFGGMTGFHEFRFIWDGEVMKGWASRLPYGTWNFSPTVEVEVEHDANR